MKVLVTGARGLLGPFVVERLRTCAEVFAVRRRDCDLRDPAGVDRMMRDCGPDVVVHAAAYTDVDGCERDPTRARLDNMTATQNVVAACSANTHVVYVSTDQVYPDTPGLHREAETGPVNVYGRTKLEGERAVAGHAKGLVLRVNFFAESRTPGRRSLSDVVVRALDAGERFPGFVDSRFSPLHALTLADHLAACVESGVVGTFNLGSTEGRSKAEFAAMVARHLGYDEGLVIRTVSSEMPGRAPRPHDLRMDVAAYVRATDRMLPTLEAEVHRL